MTREEMMDVIINRLGFENDYTLWFCRACETVPKNYEIVVKNCFEYILENA